MSIEEVREKYGSEAIWETRKDFNRKIQELMDREGFVDIDEGPSEAVTEKTAGTVMLYDEEGRIYSYFFVADYEERKVEIYSSKGIETFMEF